MSEAVCAEKLFDVFVNQLTAAKCSIKGNA